VAERPRITQLPGTHTRKWHVPAEVLTSTTFSSTMWVNNLNATIRITRATFTPESTLSGTATNFMVLAFVNKSTTGSGVTVIASSTLDNLKALTNYQEHALVLHATTTSRDIQNGEVVGFEKRVTANGATLMRGLAQIEFQFT